MSKMNSVVGSRTETSFLGPAGAHAEFGIVAVGVSLSETDQLLAVGAPADNSGGSPIYIGPTKVVEKYGTTDGLSKGAITGNTHDKNLGVSVALAADCAFVVAGGPAPALTHMVWIAGKWSAAAF
jgi:hypothetical protein